jgi:hypothetical protein
MREDLIVEASFPPSSPESSRHNPSSYIVSIIRGDHESRERSRIVLHRALEWPRLFRKGT